VDPELHHTESHEVPYAVCKALLSLENCAQPIVNWKHST
jgi:hypothetical protein